MNILLLLEIIRRLQLLRRRVKKERKRSTRNKLR
ncbi:ORF217 [Staphylococcus phage 96]|uniref:ORF217 n=1 Tax=Staphylococcus phage 96 TaxID=2936815 RepID=Q4ZBS6_9CAUD|nr:ORF217 [Staphylococcus phage 96]AAX91496.1 ORF217 [Staphylococcus phage 96]